MGASTHLGNGILDLALRGVDYAAPARVYLSLHTGDPDNTGANEVSTVAWPSYKRQDPAAGGAVGTGFTAASAKAAANAKQMLFARHDGAAPLTVTHVCVWTAAIGGTMLLTGQLIDSAAAITTKTIAPDDECVVYAGELLFAVV